MIRTPKSSSVVSARNAKGAELSVLANKVLAQRDAAKSEPPRDFASLQQDDRMEKQHEEKHEIFEHMVQSRPSRSQSVASSVMARKKRLELEAAEAKTRLQIDLIDKKLAVDLAELEEEQYSPLMEKQQVQTKKEVEKWLERSQNDMDSTRNAHEQGQQSGEPCQPPPPSAINRGVHETTEDTLHMLASAVNKLTTASTHNVPNLLSRLSTPRDLPVFSGDPMEWLQFKQAFEESTEVCDFTPKENLWRLRKCLRDKAKDTVSALLISATSTETIMATLELRFGNPDTIISKITQDLQKLQPMSQEYHKDIVMFTVKIKNYVAAVNAVGRQEYLQGVSIASLILSKLPTVLISRWSDYSYPLIKESKKSRLELLTDFLHEEALKASTTASIGIFPTRSNVPHQHKNPQKDSKHNLHTVLLQSQGKDKCLFCRAAVHTLTECKQFKKALRKERWRHVKRHGVCYRCLVSRHSRETCTAPACDKDGCGGAHHRLLHYVVNNRRDGDVTEDHNTIQENHNAQETSDTPATSETVTNINASDNKVLLKVISVNIHGPNGTISATALLDDGSTISLISSDLASRAGLQGRKECLRVRGAWKGNELVCESTVMNVSISDVNNENVHDISVRSVTELNLPKQNLAVVNCNNYPHLLKIKDKLQCNINCQPDILIGQDNYHLLLPLKVSLGKPNEPSASLTPLGWCIHGVIPHKHTLGSTSTTLATLLISGSSDGDAEADEAVRKLRDIHEEVRHYFTIDSLGVTVKTRQNVNDLRALAQLEQTAVLVNGEWHVGLPWKNENCKMPDSYPSALKRLKGVEKKMSSNTEYSQRYVERVDHLFVNGFAREIDEGKPSGKVWYLPHFGVDNPNKRNLRLVFDAAAKAGGMSLNDYLLKGPDLLASLFGIMVRFRENRIAVAGDIKDMFLKVKIRPEDQDALRFLWRSHLDHQVKKYAMTSLIFGANCSPFIAQFVKNKNALRFASSMPAAVTAICEQHYMDDYLDSLPDEETAIEMVRNIINIHKQGNFHICNWASNSVTVLDSIPKEALGSAAAVGYKLDQCIDPIGLQQNVSERTLGLVWYPRDDTLGFDVTLKRIPDDIIQGKKKPTKRILLQVVMSIFDVFGFLAPFTVQGKILLQDTWRANLDWDDIITDEIFRKWKSWIDLLKVINKIRIPRCYQLSSMCASNVIGYERTTGASATKSPSRDTATSTTATSATSASSSATRGNEYTNLQLHVYSDASVKAMCAVAYWRWEYNGIIRVAFIASKCRVAPVKPTTVPRLELQAALLAARLADTLIRESKLSPTRRYFWCDSTTVLHWIGDNTRSYKTFVANRLGEIDELTRRDEWRYVPSKLNIADVATREAYDDHIFQTEWLQGPSFLWGDESSWPPHILELKGDTKTECINTVTSNKNLSRSNHLPIPEPERFSSWLRLKRATGTVLRFINKCRKQTGEINCDLMDRAELLLLKQAQLDSFSEEITVLGQDKIIDKSSKLLTLSPILDENGLLRVGGRIDAALNIPSETKRPIILDGAHQVARLLVKHYHVKCAHGNQETVVNNLKEKYWIIRLRPTVKYVASRCMLCRIRKATPKIPVMGDLPAARLAHHYRPFTHCGLDLFGPMEVTEGRRRMKRYGVLFTCMTVRAIHVEIVHSLTSDSLIMALRRMAARRGWPQQLYSDNGTNLRGADAELKKAIKDVDYDSLKNEAVNNGTKWNFIPPRSPHWGGAWERLIRSVKTSLKVILKERAPKDEVLRTLLAEVEQVVNSRPLIHVSVEPGSPSSLTPNHFLIGTASNLPVPGSFDDSDLYVRKQWRTAQRLADMFWRRWVKEILPELLPRTKWHREQNPLKTGDLVLLVDPDSPRNVWPKGVIQKTFPGRDGRVRVVEIKTMSGVLKRSAARVAPVPMVEC